MFCARNFGGVRGKPRTTEKQVGPPQGKPHLPYAPAPGDEGLLQYGVDCLLDNGDDAR
jgi:hypothetical protein